MSDPVTMGLLLKKLLGGGGGPVGTAQQPWNPASKLAAGLGDNAMPMGSGMGNPAAAPSGTNAQPTSPQGGSFGQQLGMALIPNTMKAMSGKGGSGG